MRQLRQSADYLTRVLRRRNIVTQKLLRILSAAVVILIALPFAQAQVYTVVAIFTDGWGPDTNPLARDAVGNLYAVGGYTAVLKIDPTGKVTTLYNFKGAPDGWWPVQAVRDPEGNLYGTTQYGGTGTCNNGPFAGCGTVFKVTATGEEKVLHSFKGIADGSWPGGLIRDASGNLYGTTVQGGSYCNTFGCGVVYKIDPTGKQTVLHRFTDGKDGAFPYGDLLLADGALYGTTAAGGTGPCKFTPPAVGCGVVFKLEGKKETVLYNFQGPPDGQVPQANIVRDAADNLYGTTTNGGDAGCNHPYGCGVIFKLDPTGKETILHTFKGQNIPPSPGGLVIDPEGNVYGSAYGPEDSSGYIFKVDSSGQFSVLYSFAPGDFGAPTDLILDEQGNLYGSSGSAVFKLTP
jgi:uncharacterized repeat protein (TIGR03803 family)